MRGEEGLSRKLVRVKGESFEGWGCSDCAWVFNPSGLPVGRSLDEMKRNAEDSVCRRRYIAFELAHVAARAGSQITVLHRGPRPLALFDPDLVDQLVERTRDLDIDVRLATEAIGIEQSSARLTV